MDLLWGFNHIVLAKRAGRLMQMATSLGVLQPTVLGFGVHGGPAAMQKCVNDCFKDLHIRGVSRTFIDDTAVGTGKANSLPHPLDVRDPRALAEFREHLSVLKEVLGICEVEGLKFKLDKCNFAQMVAKVLGFVIGQGIRSLDSDKVSSVATWPRPNRLGDTDRFVGFTGFLRTHCASSYSKYSKSLRALQKSQMKAKGDTKWWRTQLKGLPEIAEVTKEGQQEFAYIADCIFRAEFGLKPAQLLRSGDLPWSTSTEKDFRELKRLVILAVDLFVPDFIGGRDGTNAFLVFPDACGYAVGAGLFQFGPRPGASQLPLLTEKMAKIRV